MGLPKKTPTPHLYNRDKKYMKSDYFKNIYRYKSNKIPRDYNFSHVWIKKDNQRSSVNSVKIQMVQHLGNRESI